MASVVGSDTCRWGKVRIVQTGFITRTSGTGTRGNGCKYGKGKVCTVVAPNMLYNPRVVSNDRG